MTSAANDTWCAYWDLLIPATPSQDKKLLAFPGELLDEYS